MSQHLLTGIVLGIIVVCILAGMSSIDVRSASDQIRRALLDFEREKESLIELIKKMLDEHKKKK